MKTLVIIFSVVSLMTLNSCKQETNVQALLENAETRNEIVNVITGNHTYMMEFMEGMNNSDHAIQMMQENKNMMSMMMKDKGMQMIMNDSMMIKNMMQGMMKNGKMMGNMMKMMHDKEMMSKDCMETCMSMMKDKGMKMGQMNDDNSNDHESHNH